MVGAPRVAGFIKRGTLSIEASNGSRFARCLMSSGTVLKSTPTRSGRALIRRDCTSGMNRILVTRWGLPELVVDRLPLVHADELLRTLWTAACLADETGCNWDSLGKTLKPNPTFEPLAEEKRRRIFCDARTYYGNWEFRANAVSLSSMRA